MSITSHERGLSRRAFLGLGATRRRRCGRRPCGLRAADEQRQRVDEHEQLERDRSSGTPNFMTAPDPIDDADIAETIEADIVIVEQASPASARLAPPSRTGRRTSSSWRRPPRGSTRSNQIGCIGGKIQEDLGIHIDKNAVVGQIMKECGYRPNQRILNLWADNSGEAFDWYLAASEGQYVWKPNPIRTTASP